ncbi:putative multidrug resistance protein 4 [Lyophyllum shimeji]|uniref:Multidrug resistance protein 4 n=1 Tax=Lyophyllum shimeji TaxID=47721 RepID=A0A9P3PU50_LYOSH|nr:putative multidrug resistance protein 4 [Lyophyllum shimeji]
MPTLFVGSLIVPVGLFWYGWSAEAKLHWMMPIVGSGIFAFGVMATWLPILLYLVDAFEYAASATAAAYVLRSLLGFVFPLFGKQMFDRLGLGGGNSLLAGLSILLGIPISGVDILPRRGHSCRTKRAVYLVRDQHGRRVLPKLIDDNFTSFTTDAVSLRVPLTAWYEISSYRGSTTLRLHGPTDKIPTGPPLDASTSLKSWAITPGTRNRK